MNLAEWLWRNAAAAPDRPALFDGTDCMADYAGFRDRVARVAGWLAAQGIGPGSQVALFMKNGPEYLIAQYAVWASGAAAVPINAKLHGREAAWIIGNSEAALTFASDGLDRDLSEAGAGRAIVTIGGPAWVAALSHAPLAAPVPRDAGDLVWLFYTSGTTGRPKGVMITARMLIAMALAYCTDVDSVTPEDAALYAAPMSHGAGIYNLMHVLKGARHVFPPSGGFDPAEIFDLARHHGRIHMFAAPTMVKRLTEAARASGAAGEGLRTVVYAGGPMYVADILEAVDLFGPVFAQVYGQGECPMGITVLTRDEVTDRAHPQWRDRLGSVGRAQSPVTVAIADAGGRLLGPGEHGEIVVRGDMVMPGYWRNPEATARTIRDGWLWTGDMGSMDADGYVTMRDRSKDLIISGGSNIYPREVEEALLTHASVTEVAVVGRPHPEWGEEVVAFVVPAPGIPLDPAALDAHCLTEIARFKRPKTYVAVAELPKNNYGKVLKTDLRARLVEDSQPSSGGSPTTDR